MCSNGTQFLLGGNTERRSRARELGKASWREWYLSSTKGLQACGARRAIKHMNFGPLPELRPDLINDSDNSDSHKRVKCK